MNNRKIKKSRRRTLETSKSPEIEKERKSNYRKIKVEIQKNREIGKSKNRFIKKPKSWKREKSEN